MKVNDQRSCFAQDTDMKQNFEQIGTNTFIVLIGGHRCKRYILTFIVLIGGQFVFAARRRRFHSLVYSRRRFL